MHPAPILAAVTIALAVPLGPALRAQEPPAALHTFGPPIHETWQHAEPATDDLVPEVRVLVMDEPFWLPLYFATRAASSQFDQLGRDVELVSSGADELSDGTRVNVGEVHWTANLGLGVRLRSLLLSAFHEGHWIMVMVTTGAGEGPLPEALREIAYSLRPVRAQRPGGAATE